MKINVRIRRMHSRRLHQQSTSRKRPLYPSSERSKRLYKRTHSIFSRAKNFRGMGTLRHLAQPTGNQGHRISVLPLFEGGIQPLFVAKRPFPFVLLRLQHFQELRDGRRRPAILCFRRFGAIGLPIRGLRYTEL